MMERFGIIFPLESKQYVVLQQNPWTTFRVGLFSGIVTVLLCVIVVAGKFVVVTYHTPTYWCMNSDLHKCI